jgi:hypothetical protein
VKRRSWVVLIVVVAAVCVAVVVLVQRPWGGGPAIRSKALGVWQEQTAVDPVQMTVSSADAADDGTPHYWVDLPASFQVPAPARLEGDVIVVLSGEPQEVVWRITYDEGADVLLLTRPDGSERHVLRRVSR